MKGVAENSLLGAGCRFAKSARFWQMWDSPPKSPGGHCCATYNGHMRAYVISNPVPTPEEMGEILGLSSDRVTAVRRIMSTPAPRKVGSDLGTTRRTSRGRSSRGSSARTAARK